MGEPVFFRKARLDPDWAQELYDQGMCDQQIADELFVAKETVTAWRWKNRLPGHKAPLKTDEKKKKSNLVADVEAARARGMSYGQYMVARKEGKV